MSNFSFSFAPALWGLPLAAVPVVLHLLFKQKSPVVQFSTLRFIKLSIQKTASKKRIHQWLLLACRALLIALLIYAVAQPVHQLTAQWASSSRSTAAAIVVDTSYSMQIHPGQNAQTTLLSKADTMVQELLHDQLASAKVALFQSQPAPADHPEQLQDASALLTQWSPLQPQASSKPLVDRVAAAVYLLDQVPADEKWLVVLSDFQSQEFTHPMPRLKTGRTVLLDLQPATPRSSGITRVAIDPTQPIPGMPSQAAVEVTSQSGNSSAVTLKIQTADGDLVSQSAPMMATPDSTGRASILFPIKLPLQRWLLLTASLTADDAMSWDNQRTQLIEVPARQRVGVLQQSAYSSNQRVLTLALDPSEGALAQWPLVISKINAVDSLLDVIVAPLAQWPTLPESKALLDFARAGKTIILFLSPGLAQSWSSLPHPQQDALAQMLPSPPSRSVNLLCHAAVANAADPLLQGLTDEKYQLTGITLGQMVSLSAGANASAILNAIPIYPTPDSRPQGLLFRNPVGHGVCFTWALLPDSEFTNLATHPTFLPLLVRMALKTTEQSFAKNIELGQPLSLNDSMMSDQDQLQIEGPLQEQYRVQKTTSGDRQFIFNNAQEPGLYRWRTVDHPQTIAITNVQLPASESDLTCRPPDTLAPPGSDTIIASSINDLSSKVTALTAPQPQWSIPLAIVMFLMCLEALMGNGANQTKTQLYSRSTH